jgi:hypothetical protein
MYNSSGPYYAKGRYLCRIIGQGFSEAKSGTPQFFIRFVVGGAVDPRNPKGDILPVEQQYERTMYRALTEKTMDFVLEDIRQLGYQGTKLSDLDPATLGFHSFDGREVEMYCNHETYEGQTREKWGIGREGLAPPPMEQSKVKALDQLFGKYARAAGKPGAGPRVTHTD